MSADLFAEYFRAINIPDNQFYQANGDVIEFNRRFLNTETNVMIAELDVENSIQEIDNAISELNLGRSGGPDKLLNELIIHERNVLSPHLCKLFSTLPNKGYFPSMWAEGYVVPIHKKGNVSNLDNYVCRDEMTMFAETPAGLQKRLETLKSYCNRWKLTVNIEKTKIMIIRKGGILQLEMRFFYNNQEIEIVKTFSYLVTVFTPGGSFSNAQ